ncbi:Glycosyltransferase involved in cell wall bisynthesis [Lachnospiraceae bacterium XBB2008]|nr:Glycosyltransferase involved in cell wall bisynthesis [Lachnospiraceae bacterium XBB2008]
MCKISVIIPVYNRGFCIGECIESVQRQTVADLEIICVDDGSTDDTVDRINEYITKDSRIKLYSVEHLGPGAARNYGIKKAKGRYVSFLDSDDLYLDSDSLEIMICAAEDKQMSVCGSRIYRFVDGVHIMQNPFVYLMDIEEYGTEVRFADIQYPYEYTGFIYRREFLLDNNIIFPDYKRCEDPVFQAKALNHAEEYLMTSVRLYEVRTIPGKLEVEWNSHYVLDTLKGIKELIDLADKYDYRILKSIALEYTYENTRRLKENADGEGMRLLNEICASSDSAVDDSMAGVFMYYTKHCPNLINKIEQYLRALQVKTVLIYGMGKYGKTFYGLLSQTSVEILGGIDRKADSFEDIPVYHPDDDLPVVDAIMITTRYSDGIREQLESRDSARVLNTFVMLDEIMKSIRQSWVYQGIT